MRFLSWAFLATSLLACNGTANGALNGAWILDSASHGFAVPPRTITLSQHGTAITGTGSAMGVDVPIALAITGTYTPADAASPSLVALSFRYRNGGGMTAEFDGALQGDRIVGSVTYYGITDVPQLGTLAFRR
jgi:hypothetical protein